MAKRKVTLALPWTDPAGKNHKPNSTVEVDRPTANNLVRLGLARRAEDKPASTPKTKSSHSAPVAASENKEV